jgi:phosphoglycolate phosphatase-like HAD superfamily hydrolase
MVVTVFDIDGVLADVRHRLHHLDEHPKNWSAFFMAAVDDPLLSQGKAAVDEAVNGGSQIIYVTGRPSRYRRDTRMWLDRHDLPRGELHMRPNRDRRPARFYKAEVIGAIAREHDLVTVIDDDDKVVAHLRELGLPVLHATWMHEQAPERQLDLLEQAQESEGRT